MRILGFKVQSPFKRVYQWDSRTLESIDERLKELESATAKHETAINRIERKQNREGLSVRRLEPLPEADVASFMQDVENRISQPWGF